jgi:ABC-type branched-subunit amino acid transport system substrate-binding protein
MQWKIWMIAGLLTSIAMTAAAEEGVSKDSILIGQTVGLTGTVAGAVKELNEGANLYITGVNQRGGVYGRKIILRTVDDKFLPDTAAANAEKLITQDRVFALFLSRGTPQTEALLPLLATHKVPLVAPSTGGEIFHTPVNHWLFNVRTKYQDEVVKAIAHFATVGIKKIGLLTYEKEDSLGLDGFTGFKKGMAANNLSPAIITIFPRLKPDIKATAAKVIAAKPAALIIVSSGKNTIDIIKELRAQGGNMQIMTLSNNASRDFATDLGPAGNGVLLTQVMPTSSALNEEFKLAAKGTGVTESSAAMEGFVSAKVLVEGLRRAGRDPTREGFVRALESMKLIDLGGLTIHFGSQSHTGSQFVEITMLSKSGRFVR